MNLTFKISVIFLVVSMALLTGCQSGFLSKPDLSKLPMPDFSKLPRPDLSNLPKPDFGKLPKPELGKLAFWKNDRFRLSAKQDDVPPPSRHFSPDPGEGSETRNPLKSNVDEILANAKEQGSNTKTEPIRKPYSLAAVDSAGSGKKSSTNDFVLNKTLDQIQTKSNQALDATQKAIGSANSFVSKTTDNIKSASSALSNTKNSFDGWQNELKNTGENQIQKAASALKSQATQTVADANKSINQFTSAATSSVGNSIANVTNSLDNAFKPGNTISNEFYNRNESKTDNTKVASIAPHSTANVSTPKNDFVSKYKQAAEQFGKSNTDAGLQAGTIKQSSFNSELTKPTTRQVQVAAEQPTTQYPSTTYGKFKPLEKDEPAKETFKIPPQLLRGNSSFSPGSVKPLRPVTTEK